MGIYEENSPPGPRPCGLVLLLLLLLIIIIGNLHKTVIRGRGRASQPATRRHSRNEWEDVANFKLEQKIFTFSGRTYLYYRDRKCLLPSSNHPHPPPQREIHIYPAQVFLSLKVPLNPRESPPEALHHPQMHRDINNSSKSSSHVSLIVALPPLTLGHCPTFSP